MASATPAEGDRSLRTLPSLLLSALRLVWSTSRRRSLVLLVVQVASALALLASVLVVNQLLSAVLLIGRGTASLGAAAVPLLVLAVLGGLTTVSSSVAALQERVLGEMVERAVWRDVLEVCHSVDLQVFDDPGFFDQAARVEENAAWRTRVVVQAMATLAGDVLAVIAGTAGLLSLAPLLAPPLLLAGVPLLLASRLAGRREFAFAVEQSQPYREREYLQEILTHRNEAKEVRAFSLSTALRSRWESSYSAYLTALNRHVRSLTRLAVTGGVLSSTLTAAAMLVALLLVARGELDVSAAGAALVAVRLLGSRVSSLSRGLSTIFEASLFLSDLQRFRSRARRDKAEPGPLLPEAPGEFDELVASNISFTYPGADEAALKDVSIRIQRGEVVALVGENGSGKTTLAKLLADLFEPDDGAIFWDGVDVRHWDSDSVRRRIAVLFQDFIRYRFTAHTNIGLGRADEQIAEDRIRAAAEQADADGFLRALPAGYDTVLGKEYAGGTDLSLGQWQRVALARAFVRNAAFVILDEPSASLDPRAEHDLFERIRSLFTGRTVLVISHRFSTVRSADRIYVMAEGRVVESGGHTELMEREGLYAELFQLQASKYAETEIT